LRSLEAHLGDRRYSSYSFLPSALEGGEWSASRPGRALPPGKEPPVPTVQGAGWAPESVWTQRLEEKSPASVGDRTPAAQSVVRHCTDWATRLTALPWQRLLMLSHIAQKSLTANDRRVHGNGNKNARILECYHVRLQILYDSKWLLVVCIDRLGTVTCVRCIHADHLSVKRVI
jgi:hypothetical protein